MWEMQIASAGGLSHGIGNENLPGEWIGGFVRVDPSNNRTHLNESYIITRINGKLFAGSVGKFAGAVQGAIAEQRALRRQQNRETGGVIARCGGGGSGPSSIKLPGGREIIFQYSAPADVNGGPGGEGWAEELTNTVLAMHSVQMVLENYVPAAGATTSGLILTGAGIAATAALIAGVPESGGSDLIALPFTVLLALGGVYQTGVGIDLFLMQINTDFGTNFWTPGEICPIFPSARQK